MHAEHSPTVRRLYVGWRNKSNVVVAFRKFPRTCFLMTFSCFFYPPFEERIWIRQSRVIIKCCHHLWYTYMYIYTRIYRWIFIKSLALWTEMKEKFVQKYRKEKYPKSSRWRPSFKTDPTAWFVLNRVYIIFVWSILLLFSRECAIFFTNENFIFPVRNTDT